MEKENEYDIVCNLKTILADKDMSIRQLTEMTELNFETVRRLYHDNTVQYHRRSIAAVCVALDVGINELLSIRNEE